MHSYVLCTKLQGKFRDEFLLKVNSIGRRWMGQKIILSHFFQNDTRFMKLRKLIFFKF